MQVVICPSWGYPWWTHRRLLDGDRLHQILQIGFAWVSRRSPQNWGLCTERELLRGQYRCSDVNLWRSTQLEHRLVAETVSDSIAMLFSDIIVNQKITAMKNVWRRHTSWPCPASSDLYIWTMLPRAHNQFTSVIDDYTLDLRWLNHCKTDVYLQWNLSITDKLVQIIFVHYNGGVFCREVLSIIAF